MTYRPKPPIGFGKVLTWHPKKTRVCGMKLTPENKVHIDSLSYESLLSHWRFAPVGDTWFQDETGKYWGERMAELIALPETDHVDASKAIGWGD